jgi:hypothetical protein
MHNTQLIRRICGRISREGDECEMEELLLLLNAVILNELEDNRVHVDFLRRKYAIVFDDTLAGES